ncbi:MerR family transcriptional regulator [Nocardiopsis sp. MG754419]|uniref:MerR family transcriptional regulator n=1 Tax=Nocardiopsis sp. MG754419 TaxID=2259865 RepID=UPI001BA85B87|nr:MerR family transcriptional regulator [Nocardiopsis sp. MG754419]MBR8740648.1 MerR family transcriptional regulator [Nocardiopsis sp. MG754419]
MRSRELAELAGVTVRTVRHYHQIGLLPEPPRSVNGYRRYTADDLVRLLRVRHLVEVGVGLSDVPEVLDEESSTASTAVLDRVEADIDARISRLRTQRDLVRSLRAERRDPEAAEGATGALAAVHGLSGLSAEAVRLDNDVATLILHLSGGDSRMVEEGLTAIRALDDVPAFFAAINGLAELAAEATDEERRAVADDLRPHLAAIELSDVRLPSGRLTRLLDELRRLRLNPAQSDALARAVRREADASDTV